MATRTNPRDSSSSNPPTSASASATALSSSSSLALAPAPAPAPSHLPISALISPSSQNPTQSQSQSQSQVTNSPSSLLWAYQLRQEHVALSTRMDRLNALFTKATNTIANLDSNVGQIADGMQVLEQQRDLDKQEYDARVQELLEGVRLAQSVEGGGDPGRFEEVLERVVKVEAENGRLISKIDGVLGKIGGLERENRGLRGDVDGLLKKVDGLQSENSVLKKDVKKVLLGSEELEKAKFSLRGDFSKFSGRFKTLEAENAELRKSLDDHVQASHNLSAESAELAVRVSELEKALQQKERESISSKWSSTTAGEDKGKQESGTRTASKARSISQKRGQSELSLDADQDTIIPDSIPTPPTRHSRHRGISFPNSTLSDTTYGSQTDLDTRSPAESLRRGTARRSQLREGTSTRTSTTDDKKNKDKNRILEQVRQNGRSLGSFLKLVDGFRMQNPNIPAEMFVMAFQEAIEDESDKRRVTEFTGRVGLVWDRLSRLVHDIEWDKRNESDEGDRDKKQKVVVDAPKRDAAGESLSRRREKKGRRSIPIVDEDDDDELFVT